MIQLNGTKIAYAILTDEYPREQYDNLLKVKEAIDEAWITWENRITAIHYIGADKPEEPTESFVLEWCENEPYECDFDEAFLLNMAKEYSL